MQRKASSKPSLGPDEACLDTLSSGGYDSQPVITTSTFNTEKHVLSVETDGNMADSKPKQEKLPLILPPSPQPNGKGNPRELSSLPAKPAPLKPKRNQVDATSDLNNHPVRKCPSNNPNVVQSLPAFSNNKKPANTGRADGVRSPTRVDGVRSPTRADGVRSPTRSAPKPPPKSRAANGIVKKQPLPPPRH